MPDPVERFIAAATAPLADNAELQMTAAEELRQGFEGREINAEKLEKTAEILESRKRRRSPWLWLYAATAVAVLAVVAMVAPDYQRYQVGIKLHRRHETLTSRHPSGGFRSDTVARLPALLGDFTAEESMLLFGDLSPGRVFTPTQFEAAWLKNPDNPMLLAQHGRAVARRGSLPPDFIKEADRLDPRNSAFRLLAAGVAARKAVGEASGKLPYAVKDAVAFEECLRLLREAAQQADYRSYYGELFTQRLAILPQGQDVLGRTFACDLVYDWQPSEVPPFVYVGRVIQTKAHELASTGDAEGFRELCSLSEVLGRRILGASSAEPVEAQHARYGLLYAVRSLAKYAQQLNLDDLASRYGEMSKKLDLLHLKRQQNGNPWGSGRTSLSAESILFNGPSVALVAYPGDSELLPGRMAEHALRSRLCAYGICAVMLAVALVFALARFRHGYQARRISASLARAVGAVDYAWIIGIGMVLPMLLHYSLEYLTPLGGHAWSSSGDEGKQLRIVSLMVAMLVLSCEVATARLARYYDLSGESGRPSHWRWLGLLLFVPWLLFGGLPGLMTKDSRWLPLVFIPLAVAGAGSLRGFLLAVLGQRHEKVLLPMAYCRLMPPVFVAAALLAILSSFALHAEERFWIKRDEFTRFEAGIPTGYRYSAEAAKRARADLLEIFVDKP